LFFSFLITCGICFFLFSPFMPWTEFHNE
jgi:hypothetical protein